MGIFVPKSELGTPNGLPRNIFEKKISDFGNEKALPLSKTKRICDTHSTIKVSPLEVCLYCKESN